MRTVHVQLLINFNHWTLSVIILMRLNCFELDHQWTNNFYHRLLWWILKQQLVMFWNQCFLLLYIVCTLKNLLLKCNTQEFSWSIQTIEQTEKARMYSCCPTSRPFSFKSWRSVLLLGRSQVFYRTF